jgi:hypothetical protein
MKAIYGFTMMPNHYKPMNDEFIRLARLSVASIKKYYNTKFYCDKKSLNFFTENGITFDEVVIINQFSEEYVNHYSISKIYAMMNETEPYILFDFDVVLFEKLESKHTITYGQPELIIGEYLGHRQLQWINKAYLTSFNDYAKEHFTEDEINAMDWLTYPSFCVLMVKNPSFVNQVYKEIFSKIPKKDILRITPTLLEQFLFHQYVIKHMVDFGFFVSNIYYNEGSSDFMSLTAQKFVHFNINKETIKEELEYLEKIV